MDIADATYSEHINSKSFVIRKFLSKFFFLSIALTLILIAGLRPIGLDRD